MTTADPTLAEMNAALAESREQLAAYSDLTDDGLALGFIRTRPQYRRVEGWGRWMCWDGQRWREDSTLALFSDVREFLRWRAKFEAKDDATARRLRNAQTVAAVERLARCDQTCALRPEVFDADPWILNTPGGVVDLRTGRIGAHEAAHYLTRMTAVAPAGECPQWMAFLAAVTAGNADLIEFLQRMAGYCLTGSTREHALFFLWGSGGNGKGTFVNTLTGLLADYAAVASMETFTEAAGERHSTDLAMLRGARLVTAQETESGRRWAEARIKSLTAGDPITARFMRQDNFTFTPQLKLLVAGNYKPRLAAVDEAIRRRLHLVPFTVTIPADQRDLDLAEKLRAEWPGILTWAIAGCLDYLSRGLDPPACIRAATDEYLEAQDVFAAWLEACCETGPEFWDPPRALFRSWTKYAEMAGERPGRQRDFLDRMEAAGYRQGRDRVRGRYWSGLKVRNAPETVGGDP